MRKQNCIITSEAKTKTEKKERDEIVDAIINSPMSKEPDEIVIVTFSELDRQMKELKKIPTRAKHEDNWLRNMDELYKYMLSRDIDVIVADDIVEVAN